MSLARLLPLLVGALLSCLLAAAPVYADEPAQAPADDIRAIKAPVDIPEPAQTPPYGWIALGGLLALAGAYAFLRRQQRPVSLSMAARARRELDGVRGVLAPEHSRLFCHRVSLTMRRYIEERFQLAATARTSEEFLDGLQASASAELRAHEAALERFLSACDLAKYAGQQLAAPELEELLMSAISFVDATAIRSDARGEDCSTSWAASSVPTLTVGKGAQA